WYRNKAVHLISKGAMRPWSCRDVDCPVLVLLPDQRQTRDFVADSEVMGLFNNISMLPEISLSEDETKSQALRVSRGGVLEKFKNSGGILAATPASLLAPFSLSGDWFRFKTGDDIGRNDLITWLTHSGYERSDIVWSPGQFVSRGSIVDIFSPSDPFPLRIEFFDDTAESVRFFMPETQKSLRTLHETSIQSLRSGSDSELEKYFPENMRVIFFDPNGLDTTAENATWLWNNLDRTIQNVVPWQKWEDMCKKLAKYNRLRVTADVKNTSVRMPLRQFPLFRGKLKELELYCVSLAEEGYSISIYSESQRNLEWGELNSFKSVKGTLSEGFIDAYTKEAVITDLELAGVSVPRHRLESHAPSDWGAGLIQGQYVVHDDYGVALYLGPQTVETSDGAQEYLVLQFAGDRRLLIPVMHFWKISSWSPMPGQEAVLDNLKSSHWKKSAAKAREMAEKAAKELVEIYAAREMTHGFAFAN
ncbi:MAG: CarD family transcriptional regulator, partial [Synergistaceae bacterium]